MHTSSSKSPRGFTLIETIVVVSITTVVMLALTNIIVTFYRENDYVLQEAQAVGSARQGLNASMQYLREASYGADGTYPLSSAATSTITFYADVNNDGTVEKITLSYANGTLTETMVKPTGTPPTYSGSGSTYTLASYLVNSSTTPVFQYVSSTTSLLNTSTMNLTDVYAVITTLKVDVDQNRSPAPYTLTSTAALRILRGQ